MNNRGQGPTQDRVGTAERDREPQAGPPDPTPTNQGAADKLIAALRGDGPAEVGDFTLDPAEARRKLAEALKLYNEAGLSIEALKVLPEIAAAVSEPLARAGETTIISNGGNPGDGTGAARLTDDVVQVLTQLGPVMKQLSGVDLDTLLQNISRLPGAVADSLDSQKDS